MTTATPRPSPAPWTIRHDAGGSFSIVSTTGPAGTLARVWVAPGEFDARANALMMATAPYLLETLEELLEHVEWRRGTEGETAGPNDVTHRARAAIAHAKGATP